jgi:hypothetical protein
MTPRKTKAVEPGDEEGPDRRGAEGRWQEIAYARHAASAMYADIIAGHRRQQMIVRYTQGDTAITPPCPWLKPGDSAVASLIVREAMAHLGVCEEPPGSNRGPEIDAWNRRARVAVGSYWCASFAGAMWWSAGLVPPPNYASCDVLMQWAKDTGRWSTNVATLGALVLYGKPGDANHVGIVVRVSPVVLSVEGNTQIDSGFSRNGIGVGLKMVTATDPVLGYCHVTPMVPSN